MLSVKELCVCVSVCDNVVCVKELCVCDNVVCVCESVVRARLVCVCV